MSNTKDNERILKEMDLYKNIRVLFSKYRYLDDVEPFLAARMDRSMIFHLNEKYSDLVNEYYFPNNNVDGYRKIIIYGAGRVGRCLYKELEGRNNCQIVAWIDNGLKVQYIFNRQIYSADKVKEIEFDIIVIAVESKAVYLDIKNYT